MSAKSNRIVWAAAAALLAAGAAGAAETMTQLKGYLDVATAERARLQKENPAVEFVETDNPASNFRKTTNQKGKYPYGLTLVNRAFHCPFCKKSTIDRPAAAKPAARPAAKSGRNAARPAADAAEKPPETVDAEGLLVHAPNCNKGRAVELQWRELVAKIPLTEEYNAKIEEQTALIADIKERIEDLRLGRASTRPPLAFKAKTGESYWLESIFRAPFGEAVKNTPLRPTARPDVFEFTPRRQFRGYDRYYLSLVPSTKQIWCVRAEISPAAALGADLLAEIGATRAVMEYKYEMPARRLSPTDCVFEFAPPAARKPSSAAARAAAAQDAATNIVRKIVLSPGAITAFDVKLREKAWAEDPSARPHIPDPPPVEDEDPPTEKELLKRDAEAL